MPFYSLLFLEAGGLGAVDKPLSLSPHEALDERALVLKVTQELEFTPIL